jgi:guanylate kinase
LWHRHLAGEDTGRIEIGAMTAKIGSGAVVVISGPSGVGKSSVCHRLCKVLPAEFSVSVTTRKARPGEVDGKDYQFISRAEFERLRDAGELLEWADVYGHSYGTPLAAVKAATAEGRTIILEIDINGCIQVRKRMPEARTFFLLSPTPDEQKRRIENRKTDGEEEIRRRLAQADGEIRYAMESGCYEEFVINQDLDETTRRIVETLKCGNAETPKC